MNIIITEEMRFRQRVVEYGIVSSCCRIIKVKGIPYPFDTKPAI